MYLLNSKMTCFRTWKVLKNAMGHFFLAEFSNKTKVSDQNFILLRFFFEAPILFLQTSLTRLKFISSGFRGNIQQSRNVCMTQGKTILTWNSSMLIYRLLMSYLCQVWDGLMMKHEKNTSLERWINVNIKKGCIRNTMDLTQKTNVIVLFWLTLFSSNSERWVMNN